MLFKMLLEDGLFVEIKYLKIRMGWYQQSSNKTQMDGTTICQIKLGQLLWLIGIERKINEG